MNPDVIKYNIDQIYGQGGTDDDVEDYLKSVKVNPSEFAQRGTPAEASIESPISSKMSFPTEPMMRPIKAIANAVPKIIESGAKNLLNIDSTVAYGGNGPVEPGSLEPLKEMGVNALKGITMAVNPGGSLLSRMGVIGGVQGLSSLGQNLLQGQSFKESGRNALRDALTSAGTLGVLEKGGQLVKTGATKLGSFMSRIPEKDFSNVLDQEIKGRSLFGTSQQRGQELGDVQEKMRNMGPDNLPHRESSSVIHDINDVVRKFSDSMGLNSLPKSDIALVQEIKDTMNSIGSVPIDILDTLKDTINKKVHGNKLTLSKEEFTQSKTFLKKVADSIESHIQSIADSSPIGAEFVKANKAFRQAKQADQFEQWRPNIHMGFGSTAGLIGGVGAHMAGVPFSTEASILGALGLASIPKANKGLIKGIAGTSKLYNKLPSGIIPSSATNALRDILYTPDEVQ